MRLNLYELMNNAVLIAPACTMTKNTQLKPYLRVMNDYY